MRLPQPRVQRVAQPVAQQVDRQHQDRQRGAGEDGDPPFAGEQDVVADPDQGADQGLGRRYNRPEEWQGGNRLRLADRRVGLVARGRRLVEEAFFYLKKLHGLLLYSNLVFDDEFHQTLAIDQGDRRRPRIKR